MNKTEIQKHLKDIEDSLQLHYKRRGYIEKELCRAKERLEQGKEYYFKKGLFGVGHDNREHRIFQKDGKYSLFSGWGKSSDNTFHKVFAVA